MRIAKLVLLALLFLGTDALAQSRAVPQISISAAPNPSTSGDGVVISVVVDGTLGRGSGIVNFLDNGNVIEVCANSGLSAGAATCSINTLSPGAHALQATYGGDSRYEAGTSPTFTQTVNPGRPQPAVTVASSANPSAFEQPVTFTASVVGNAGAATGTVTFHDAASVLFGCSAVPLGGGTASCTVDTFMPGTHPVTATYSGDATYSPTLSPTVSQSVQPGPPAPTQLWRTDDTTPPPEVLGALISTRGSDIGPHATTDAAGNLYVASTAFDSAGGTDCMTYTKYAAGDGQIAWRRQTCAGSGVGIAMAPDGDVLVTGMASSDLYAAKLSSATGVPVWEQRIPPSLSNASRVGVAIGADPTGNARIAGYEAGQITVFGFRGSDGVVQWQLPIDSGLGGRVTGFLVDAAGNTVLGDNHQLDAQEHFANVITRIDPAGSILWRAINPPVTGGLSVDSAGNLFACGFDSVGKLDAATGTVLWTQSVPRCNATRVDAQDNVFAAGSFNTIPNNFSDSDLAVAKFNGAGAPIWSKELADPSVNVTFLAMTLDSAGDPVVAGIQRSFQSTGQFAVRLASASGHVEWLSTVPDGSLFAFPDSVHPTPSGVIVFGSLDLPGSPQGIYAIAYGNVTTPPSTPAISGISTRGSVGTDNDVVIGGFIIGGSTPKTVIVRARGPSLAAQGVANALANPTLTLVRASDQAVIATNDDWQQAANAAQVSSSGFAPSDARESAVLMTLDPGAYTAIVAGAGGASGVGIVEIFEVDHPEVPIIGISTRGPVLTGDDVMIGGFVIQGSAPQTVVVRARGPSLQSAGVANALANPTLTLVRASDQSVIAVNDDWQQDANAGQLQASGFAPSDAREAAVLVTLPPGAYTAVVSGAGGTTGVGIVEIFATQ
ncbi:MAG TPA: Ig-like domain repeat protein [Usitatibacter sp.]|nr:Ig-like domain repeat protein [Usitatibacter sp.]